MKGFSRVVVALAIVGVFSVTGTALAQELWGLGDLGIDPIEYQVTLRDYAGYEKAASPASFDWRDYGAVTPAKDQGYCGSCWAFACVGVMESKILIAGGPMLDLSEQQQVSCNLTKFGCCGGYYTALEYWYTNKPWTESCTHYDDYFTSCPTERTVLCGTLPCSDQPYNSANMFTVNTGNVSEVKTSVEVDGPAYFRYDVYDDFYGYWGAPNPGAVYTQTSGARLGGHAVLIIGWDDTKAAWLLKNSWGETDGPNGDGTFWMAWTGHAHNLGFAMANVDLVISEPGLTQINLTSPSNLSTPASAPTFVWTADGGANNAFCVDFAIPSLIPFWSTFNNMHLLIYETNWTMPQGMWNVIPSGARVYWRVRGADLDDPPLTVVNSDELWSFFKD